MTFRLLKPMDNHFINSLLLWLLFCICSVANDVSYALNCTFSERKALIDFKQSLSDPAARLSSWMGENCCEWPGITCNFISGKVTKIDLRNSLGYTNFLSFLHERQSFEVASQEYKKSCLGGEISSSLLELKYLNYLDLSLNNFEGAPIPYFFGMLENLRYLNLSSAYFSSKIPLHLGNLSNLRYLDLSASNQHILEEEVMANLQCENLQWLSGLSSLEYLDIGKMDLSSVQANWMHAFSRLSSLSELYISDCHIPTVDSSMGFLNLTSLRVLDLSENWINSLLPLWLSNLTSLTKLDLGYNYFQGTIPQDFVKLKNIQYLDLSRNNLRNIGDHMPSSLQNLCKLEFLCLANNRFGGTIDELLGNFSTCSHNSLEILDLSFNELVGEMSYSLATLQNLQLLYLSNNNLRGSLPNWIGNLSLLQYMDVSSNLLSGTIPPNFGQLTELIEFSSVGNSWDTVITEAQLVNLTKLKLLQITTDKNHTLVFNISYDWIPPFRLKTLHLRNCHVGPQFPVWLQVQTQLTGDIIISNAGICGSIPSKWISNMSSQITGLDLSNNLIEGKLSQLLASQDPNSVDHSHDNLLEDSISRRYPNLLLLYLQHNLLTGSIPSNIGDLMPNLTTLYLSKNHLNGTIPSSFQNLSNLVVLLLSDNQLSGELFDDWGKFRSLHVIDLANNYLYGKIPSSMGLLTSLENLILSNNHFHGEIPKSLQNCSRLRSIDLRGNRLYGNLPSWIGVTVSQLWLLNLRSNHFSGTIPRQWCNLPSLRVFDLSNNNLSGDIPSCLYKWTTLAYDKYSGDRSYETYFNGTGYDRIAEKTTLVMNGRELEYDTILAYVLTIDLSRNKLSGEIPREITNLLSLHVLNLSNNDLVGTIPENIGAMQNLETLDLSCNHLSGKIPASLASLNFLSHLNLSFNNLTGRIPTGKQLQTLNDPSIYEGNPLQTKSTGDENTNGVPISTSQEDGKENDSTLLLFDFYVSMAIGFPVGLNILFFTIFTSESRRISYFGFIDRVSFCILENVGFVVIFARRMRWPRRS